MDVMEKMGSIIALTEDEAKNLATEPHHYNKLEYTMASTSSSTPLRVLKDSTSRVPRVDGIFSIISQISPGLDIGNGLT